MLQKISFFLLLPFGLLYGLTVNLIRNLYKIGIFRIWQFPNLLIIKVGNLSVGGTGKTPHTAFLLRYFEKKSKKVAVVSRGYGRVSKSNKLVELSDLPNQAGDEPLMLKNQFPNAPIVVARRRAEGLQLLQKTTPYIYGVLLDDAMQHWAVQSDLDILLTTFNKPFFADFPLPAGRLREFRTNFIRANVIIVTQCPPILLPKDEDLFKKAINLQPNQILLFSYYNYAQPYSLADVGDVLGWQALANYRVLTVLAIAQTDYIAQFLATHTQQSKIFSFLDHHLFTQADIYLMIEEFKKANFDCILTTEKDAVRLRPFLADFQRAAIPVFILPIVVQFHNNGEEALDQFLSPYLEKLPN